VLADGPPASTTATKVTGHVTTTTTTYETNVSVPTARTLGSLQLLPGGAGADLKAQVACGVGGSFQVFAIVSQTNYQDYFASFAPGVPVEVTACTGKPQIVDLHLTHPILDTTAPLTPGKAATNLQLFVGGPFSVAGFVNVADAKVNVH